MFTKLLSFLTVYILTLVNFIFILLPFSLFLIFNNETINKNIKSIFFLFVFGASVLMLIFLLSNYLFNSSVKYYKKKCLDCKNKKELEKLNYIFDDIKNVFSKSNVSLLIQNSNEINAYAVGGFRDNCIILTTGIMKLCKKNAENEIEYYRLLSGIIGHEMSHIINKDFFTGLLVVINEKINRIISYTIYIFLNILSKIFGLIPFVGHSISQIFIKCYSIIKSIIDLFYVKIFMPTYHFIQLQLSKSIEYRADEQSARYCGGETMGKVLSLLGDNGFFTIFSTHPRTKTRVNKVKNIKQYENYITSVKFANFPILLSILLLLFFIKLSYNNINFEDFVILYKNIMSLIIKIKYKIIHIVMNFNNSNSFL